MDSKEIEIKNYLDMSADGKRELIAQIIGKRYFRGISKSELLYEFERSERNKLPQYMFLYYKANLVGYCLLIGLENVDSCFPWAMTNNIDDLEPDARVLFANSCIKVCRDLNVSEFIIDDLNWEKEYNWRNTK
jgi:hypothetical protein